MRKYSGKDVAVLWSGGFDSSLLALQLAEVGANVVCVSNVGGSLQKLGDIINRRRVRPLLEKHGVTFECCDLTIHPNPENTEFSGYTGLLRDMVVHIHNKYPNHTIASGIRSSDGIYYETLKLFEPFDVYTPYADMTYNRFVELKNRMVEKHNEFKHMSVCDNGHFLWHEKHVSCSLSKDKSLWCFKCHENGVDYLREVYRKHLTVDDFDYLLDVIPEDIKNEYIGSLFGHLVVKNKSSDLKTAFSAEVDDWESTPIIASNLTINIGVEERPTKGLLANRPAKKQIVSIYLSELQRLTGIDLRQPLKQNTPFTAELIRIFVENNYLPTGYEWSIHSLTPIWSKI